MKRAIILITALSIFFVGCAQRKVAKAPEAPAPEKTTPEKVTLPQPPEEKKPEEVSLITETPEGIQTEEIREGEAKKEAEAVKEGLFKDIHFDYNKYDIKPEYQEQLKRIADYLISNPSVKIIIEGHCDERGTNEYNLALGDKRANAVKDFLVSAGVSADRIETVSYGEERPLCTEHNESCWWRNRRAHFVEVTE